MEIVLLIFLVVAIVFIVQYVKRRKKLKLNAVTLITGGPKTGKSSLAIHLAIKTHKRQMRKYYFKKYLFHKDVEKPLLYSNIPLSCAYVPLTTAHLMRKVRLNYGSVCYIGEFSLVADSMSGSIVGDVKEKEKRLVLAESLSNFCKLYGHETGGISKNSVGPGVCICDTQALADVHWGLRRNVSSCIFIERSLSWIPFLMLFKVRELIYLDENSINTFGDDVEDNTKWYVCLKPWKYFDYCCYSSFTDYLPKINTCFVKNRKRDLKASKVPSFRTFKTIPSDFIDDGYYNRNEVKKNG